MEVTVFVVDLQVKMTKIIEIIVTNFVGGSEELRIESCIACDSQLMETRD